MPPIRVNKTTAYELDGRFYPTMPEAEMAVRKAVILDLLENECGSSFDLDQVADIVAQRWTQIKNDCDAAFKGV